jgi:KDO2-lipid IV(A) lauroyltransferase
MSSFNILLLALGVYNFPVQALSYPRVEGATHVDNAVRRSFGINMTPISMRSLRQAIQRLRNGGVVITAIDRPDVGGEPLTFFGRQAVLPVGHARLAIQTGSKILIGNVQKLRNGLYEAVCADLIEPVITGDRKVDVKNLAQKTLEVLEGIIRVRPQEWLVFLPVWPDFIP